MNSLNNDFHFNIVSETGFYLFEFFHLNFSNLVSLAVLIGNILIKILDMILINLFYKHISSKFAYCSCYLVNRKVTLFNKIIHF